MWKPVVIGDIVVQDIMRGSTGAWVASPGGSCCFVPYESGFVPISVRNLGRDTRWLGVIGDVLLVYHMNRGGVEAIYPDGRCIPITTSMSDHFPAAVSLYLYDVFRPERVYVPGIGEAYLYYVFDPNMEMSVGKTMAVMWEFLGTSVTFVIRQDGGQKERVDIRLLEEFAYIKQVIPGGEIAIIRGSDCMVLNPKDYTRISINQCAAIERDENRIAMLDESDILCWLWDSPQCCGRIPVDGFEAIHDIYLLGQQVWVVGEREETKGIFAAPFPELGADNALCQVEKEGR